MAIAIADIGVFFAYPWPEEQELMQQLFNAVAREGSDSGGVSHGQGHPRLSESFTFHRFPRNNHAALPVRAQRPWTINGLKKMGPGWFGQLRAVSLRALSRAEGVR